MVRMYNSCMRSAVLYGSETWIIKNNDIKRLKNTEKRIVRGLRSAPVKGGPTTEL